MDNILPVILLGFVALIWLIIFVFLLRVLIVGIRSRSWSSVKGQIAHSELRRISRAETASLFDNYRTTIIYRYNIKGIEYKSVNISFGDLAWHLLGRGLRSRFNAKKITEKYSPEKFVRVYYNPDNPKQAILEPGIMHFHYLLTFLIVIVMGAFLCMILLKLIYA
ncbi:MAG: DUF3592 domain-containing protein [Anaerolineales bacterium]|nr:DUF3592 domain-containing protein [Anaerolineales bacterium]MCA9928597.1 DUF3592 domain-containing protein [Anaerolineales bacterium]